MFITKNYDSSHLWLKKSLVKNQNVRKTHGKGYLQKLVLHLIFLLRTPIFKNSHFVGENYFIFLEARRRSNFKGFQYQIWTSVKRWKK